MQSSRHFFLKQLTAAALAVAGWAGPAAASATFEDQVMDLVNQERWNNGQLPPLKRNPLLDASSLTHSTNMAQRNFFAHCDPDNGTLPWDRMTAAGYVWNSAAENIAAGYSTPAAVMAGWMASAGHRANILSTSYRELGIGTMYQAGDQANVRLDSNGDCTSDSFNNGPYVRYWTQNFGRRSNVYPVVINREACTIVNSTVSLYQYGTGWAQDMRFRNENGTWSAWQPFASGVSWVLSPGNGTKTVNSEIRNGVTVYAGSDVIELNASADVAISLSDDQDPVAKNSNVTYRATVTNGGGSDVTGLTMNGVIPPGAAFVSCSHPSTLYGGALAVAMGWMAAGGADTVEIVLLATAAGNLDFSLDAAANEFDPDPADNSATETTTVETGSTGVPGDGLAGLPSRLRLNPARPNPFQSSTVISWYQPAAGPVRVSIFNAAGRRVALLLEEDREAGFHEVAWDGRDEKARDPGRGVYFGRLEAGPEMRTVKLLLAR